MYKMNLWRKNFIEAIILEAITLLTVISRWEIKKNQTFLLKSYFIAKHYVDFNL